MGKNLCVLFVAGKKSAFARGEEKSHFFGKGGWEKFPTQKQGPKTLLRKSPKKAPAPNSEGNRQNPKFFRGFVFFF